MYNLEDDLCEVDEKINDILCMIEDANCNVTQGYKVFKELKELRGKRKELLRELDCVHAIVECFNCDDMLEAYEYSLNSIDEIMGTSILNFIPQVK